MDFRAAPLARRLQFLGRDFNARLRKRQAMHGSLKANGSHTFFYILVVIACALSAPTLAHDTPCADDDVKPPHYAPCAGTTSESEVGAKASKPCSDESVPVAKKPAQPKKLSPAEGDPLDGGFLTAGRALTIGVASVLGAGIGAGSVGLVSVVAGGAVVVVLFPLAFVMDLGSTLSGKQGTARRTLLTGSLIVGGLFTIGGAILGGVAGTQFVIQDE